MTNDKKHPWQEFLESRKRVIDWLKEHYQDSDAKIAQTLSMDEMQVYLIRTNQTNEEK